MWAGKQKQSGSELRKLYARKLLWERISLESGSFHRKTSSYDRSRARR